MDTLIHRARTAAAAVLGIEEGEVRVSVRGKIGRPPRYTDAEMRAARAAAKSTRAAARALGISEGTLRHHLEKPVDTTSYKKKRGARK